MIPDKILLEFHRSSRDAVRAVLDKLTEEQLHALDQTRKFSIAQEVGHMVAAEHFFLVNEMKLKVGFKYMNADIGQQSTLAALQENLELIDMSWPELLKAFPDEKGLRVTLARMGFHTLYHLARIADRRARMDPDFKLPDHGTPGSWEKAIEPMILAVGE